MYEIKQSDKKYHEDREFKITHKFYCEGCRSYYYLSDKIPYIICKYCGYPVFNINNPDGKKEHFKYKLKRTMSRL